MTVAELIAELQKLPLTASVWIHDADTDWKMPIHVGHGPYNQRQDNDADYYIYGYYHEITEDMK